MLLIIFKFISWHLKVIMIGWWIISVSKVLSHIKMVLLIHHRWMYLSMIICKTYGVCPFIKLMLKHYSLLHIWRQSSRHVMILRILLFIPFNWAIVALEWTLVNIALINIIYLNRFYLFEILLFWFLNAWLHWNRTLWFLRGTHNWYWGFSTLIDCLHWLLRHHLFPFYLIITLLGWWTSDLLWLACDSLSFIAHWCLWWL